MRSVAKLLTLLALLLTLALPALAQELEIGTLSPVPCESTGEGLIDLYCGPTQGFYRDGEAMLNSGEPFLFFGQFDCWAMVAQGTLEAMGPVGWIESAAITLPETPELGFEDALEAMVEEDTFLTVTPLAEQPQALCDIARGTKVILLAQYEGWAYVQTEIGDMPARAFLPVDAIL